MKMSGSKKPASKKATARLSVAQRQSSSSLSLQNIINSRYLNPFRSSLKKEIFNSLYNGSYIDILSSNMSVHSSGNISSISIDPLLNNA